jgi:hypothetical protein
VAAEGGGDSGERNRRMEEVGESEGGPQAWQGNGSVAAPDRRAWAAYCHVTVEGGGVEATQDGVVDRWAGMRRGPVISG